MIAAAHHSMMQRAGGKYQPVYAIRSDGSAYCVLPHTNESTESGVSIRYRVIPSLYPSASGDYRIFGSHGQAFNGLFLLYMGSKKQLETYCFGQSKNVANGVWNGSGEHTVVMARSNGTRSLTVDGVAYTYSAGNAVANNAKQMIFEANAAWLTGDNVSPAGRTSSFIAILSLDYSDGTGYSCSLTPVIRGDEVGFYDRTNDEFIGNEGGGSLIALTEADFA